MLTSRTRRLASRTICKKRGECWCAIGLSEGQLIRSTVTAGHSNGQITSGRVATNMGASDYCPRPFPHSAHQEWVFVPYYCNGSTRRIAHFFVLTIAVVVHRLDKHSYGYHILR